LLLGWLWSCAFYLTALFCGRPASSFKNVPALDAGPGLGVSLLNLSSGSESVQISGSVIVDLKSEKLMDRPDRLYVGRCDANTSAVRHWFQDISDTSTLGFHDRDPRRHSVMNEHRELKIPVCEHLHDMG